MRGVGSLSGLAGPNASLKGAGAGAAGVFELLGSWIYEGDATDTPLIDFTGIPFVKGDLLIAGIARHSGSAPGSIPGFSQFGTVSSGGGRFTIYARLADGSETTFVHSDAKYQAFACAFSFGVPVDFQGTMITQDPPAVTNIEGATVLTFAFDRTPSTTTDLDVTPPSGYTLIHARENDASTWDPSIRVAIKTNCSANENPGSWSDWTVEDAWGVTTLAIEPFERL